MQNTVPDENGVTQTHADDEHYRRHPYSQEDEPQRNHPPRRVNLSQIAPVQRIPGDRTVSTAARLRRQGLRNTKSSGSNFAVRSIRRGSDDWRSLIKPFVSDLAFRSLISRRFMSEVSFRSYNCHAAVLFVDLSSYSRITAALADDRGGGAHVLSNIVNAYLTKLLKIVNHHGGDVVKFAGDAILIVWEGQQEELRANVLCAAKCVLDMQENAGSYPIEGTNLCFRIHCGLTCGILESEIFVANSHVHMQRLYHSVGGETLSEIGLLVDLAKAGEICTSQHCLEYLESRATYKDIDGLDGAKILTGLHVDDALEENMELHVEKVMADRLARRNKDVEEEFIHPSVLRRLSHGGLSPTHIAEMRKLCVLFIAMTSNGSSVNWLMEVQGILDKSRCPIVQIIDDDKGVHVVAAVNLYESIPEAGILGLDVCRDLVDKQVGCAIGMAMGSTFCGVTGSSSIACRWDITGPPPVRAARLMQYALANDLEVAIDQSVYNHPMAATRMLSIHCGVELKGSAEPCPVYGLSESSENCAFRVLETVHGRVHNEAVAQIHDFITRERSRSAVIVTGPSLSGKKIVCQRAAGDADLVPFLHLSEESAGPVQLARTIATWFRYVENENVQYLAFGVLEHIVKQRWCRAHDECVRLVNEAVREGLRACFIVDRVQFLDEFSLSIIRECLHGRRRLQRSSSSLSDRSLKDQNSDSSLGDGPGRICFLCVHVSLYNWKSAMCLVEDITRPQQRFLVPVVKIGEADRDSLRVMFQDLADMNIDDRWLDTYAEASGHCAGYFVERAAAIRKISATLWKQDKEVFAVTNEDGKISIPPGFLRKNMQVPVMRISADVAMRFSQVYDELPPLFQVFSKVLTIATRQGYFRLPRMLMWEVLNDLIAEGVETHLLSAVIDEMLDMCLVKEEREKNQNVLSLQSPALGDIAMDVCTPVQVQSIATALIDRLEPYTKADFRVPLVVAGLHQLLGQQEDLRKRLWNQGYQSLLRESKNWPRPQLERWKELIEGELSDAGYNVQDILGDGFRVACPYKNSIGHHLMLAKAYISPVSLGPMGHSLNVISRNFFHEIYVFQGATDEEVFKLYESISTASKRYLKEMSVVEDYLAQHDLAASPEDLQEERKLMVYLAAPADNDEGVLMKASKFLERVPDFVSRRLKRLYQLIEKLRQDGVPDVVENAQVAIRRAYQALQQRPLCSAGKCRTDAAQDALMTLATYNWKPKPVPDLPILYYQTVARIRSKVLKRLTDAELIIFRHQQSVDDLEVFLVVTPLLYAAQECGKC